jgi:hypothetical protein
LLDTQSSSRDFGFVFVFGVARAPSRNMAARAPAALAANSLVMRYARYLLQRHKV